MKTEKEQANYLFGQMPQEVMRHPDLTLGAKVIFTALMLFVMAKGRYTPSQSELAEETSMSERAIRMALNELEKAGFIVRTKPGHNTTEYEIHLENLVIKAGKKDRQILPVTPEAGPEGAAENAAQVRQNLPPKNIVVKKEKQKETSACSEPTASPIEEPTPTRSRVLVEAKDKSPTEAIEKRPIDLSRLSRQALTPYWQQAVAGDPETLALFHFQAPRSIKQQLEHEYHVKHGQPLDWQTLALEN